MTFSRFALYGSSVLLICLLAVGTYCYQNLPSLVAQQARVYLLQYGVAELDLGQLQVSNNQLGTNRLWLRGEYEGMRFEATMDSVQVHYNWRMLLNGQIQSVTLANLTLAVEESAKSTKAPVDSVSIESLLPQPLMAQLPLQSLEIQRWQLDYSAPGIPPILAVGNLLLQEQLSLHLETHSLASNLTADIGTGKKATPLNAQVLLKDGDDIIAELSVYLQRAAAGGWRWELEGELQHAPTLNWLLQLNTTAELALDTAPLESLRLRGDSNISAWIAHDDRVDLSPDTGLPAPKQFSAVIKLGSSIEQLDYPATVSDLAGNLDVSLELDADHLKLTIDPTELTANVASELLSLPQDTLQWLRWDKMVPLRWRSAQLINATYSQGNAGAWQLSNSQLVLGNKDSELKLDALNLDVSLHGQALLATKLNASMKTRLRRRQLPQMELALVLQGSVEDSEFQLALDDTAESLSLNLQGTMNLTTGGGNYQLSARSLDLPYAATTILPLLQDFDLLQQDVIISSGSVALNSKLKSKTFDTSTWQQQSQLAIQNLSGAYGEYRFDTMTLAADWTGIERWATRKTAEFSLARLNVGFDIVDINASLSLPEATPIEQPLVNIDQFSAGMFGGRVYLPEPQQWDFASQSNRAKLRAEQWQLADMLALQQDRDIQATGVLEGELPVEMTAGRIIIEKGYLRALAPGGSIRYISNEASQALAQTSPELELALDLLSDFQYQVLSSEVELDREGNLLLGLSLTGRNPEQYEGRPINFNINLEQNLDPLLQSLRLNDNLVEKLESRLD